MAAAKCASMAAAGADGSSVVSLMSRNGTDVGIQLAGLPGRWFTAPAAPVQDALLREGYDADDAALRHRRLGGHRVRRARRDGARRRARGRRVLRRRRGGRRGADRADGARSASRARAASPITALRQRRHARSGSTRGWSPSSTSRRRSPPASCTRAPAPGQIGAGVAHQPARAVRGRRHGARGGAVGRIVDVIDVGPNFIARPYRGVSVQDAEALDEASLRRWLIGAAGLPAHGVHDRRLRAASTRSSRSSARRATTCSCRVRDLRVLAGPAEVAFVADRRSTPATPARWRAPRAPAAAPRTCTSSAGGSST